MQGLEACFWKPWHFGGNTGGERRINELLFSLVIGSRMCLACHVYVVRASAVKRKGGSGTKKIEGTFEPKREEKTFF